MTSHSPNKTFYSSERVYAKLTLLWSSIHISPPFGQKLTHNLTFSEELERVTLSADLAKAKNSNECIQFDAACQVIMSLLKIVQRVTPKNSCGQLSTTVKNHTFCFPNFFHVLKKSILISSHCKCKMKIGGLPMIETIESEILHLLFHISWFF